jgi:hypothetical protein
MMTAQRATKALTAMALPAIIAAASAAPAGAHHGSPRAHHNPQLTVHQVLNGMTLHHRFTPAGGKPTTEPLTGPDDLTSIGLDLFTAFQNGVGPQGQPSADGNTRSTVVEFGLSGQVLGQWDIRGKCDGLTADPALGVVIATVNEDLKSSLYTINPQAPPKAAVQHYTYNEPLPHNGGTDAISIVNGHIPCLMGAARADRPPGNRTPHRRRPGLARDVPPRLLQLRHPRPDAVGPRGRRRPADPGARPGPSRPSAPVVRPCSRSGSCHRADRWCGRRWARPAPRGSCRA